MNFEILKLFQWGLYNLIFRYTNILFGTALFSFSISIFVIIRFLIIRHNNGICNISKGSVWSCQRPLLIINSENLVWRAIKILPLWIIKKGKLLGLVSSLMETLKETASSCKWNAYQLFIILWLLILDKVLFELELRIIWFIKKHFLFIYTLWFESVITKIKKKYKILYFMF